MKNMPNRRSFLFITLDSCRFDTFANSHVPNMKKVGPLYNAMAPSYFTFGSHMSMFMGFTPGVAAVPRSFLNPKYGKIFKMANGGFEGKGKEFLTLTGKNIIQGLKRIGYTTIGTGAVGWFDPATETGKILGKDFDHFYYPGDSYSIEKQLEWIDSKIAQFSDQDLFVFINIGETHVPYYHHGASWDPKINPCVPFGEKNDREECKRRQGACLEFVDKKLGPLIEKFLDASILICADHGDCWGEDGLWEHGIYHEKIFSVPLMLRLDSKSI